MEEDKILIVKSEKNSFNKANVKVRKRIKKGYVPDDYIKIVNLKDYNDLALLFEDLNLNFSSPIEKAFFKYRDRKGKGNYPFF